MARMYLGLGSNVGDRAAHLAFGVAALDGVGRRTGVSGVYESDPVGLREQGRFLNMVARLETSLEPEQVLARVHEIERDRGRVRTFRNAPRTLDIDILLYGDRVVESEALTIPHPRMAERAFVLVPLLELEPGIVDPHTGRGYQEHLKALVTGGREGDTGDMAEFGVRRVMDGEALVDVGDT